MRSSKKILKRARPLLGTFVEIALRSSADERTLNDDIDGAFEEIAVVDRLMSFHRDDSDISRLNRARPRRWIEVHPLTARVLKASNEFFLASQGAFDIRVGEQLVEWGVLPSIRRTGESRCPGLKPSSSSRFVAWAPASAGATPVELDGNRVRKTGPWILDLGGIAKGFAVDRAVARLRRRAAVSGSVNAGGDLRVFGKENWPVEIRHPHFPSRMLARFQMNDGAAASSGNYFSKKKIGGRRVSALVDRRRRVPFLKDRSVTVVAPTCLAADALTKIALFAGESAAGVLKNFQSKAFFMHADGSIQHA